MRLLARISLLLVIVLVVVSAYLRLQESGIGCPDWPACYGMIGEVPEDSDPGMAGSAYQRIVAESDAPLAWAAPLHRLVASILGLCILFLAGLSLKARKHRILCLALLGLTVFLALIGLRSGSLHHPAIVMGNLAGGFTMLGLLGWLVFRLEQGSARYTQTRIRHIRHHVIAALILLGIQIVLGGLTSANFAATACTTLPDCHGTWIPDGSVYSAFKLNSAREVSPAGVVISGYQQVAIHLAHRWGSVITFFAVVIAAVAGFAGTDTTRRVAYTIFSLLIIEMTIGIASVLNGIPIAFAVAHNFLAALLLLALLKLLALSQERWIPD